jgi:prepilin-type N-terminal cleavage/methylation domain-containing protein
MRRGGFTLIEVIIAIAILSILASMAVPYAAKLIDKSREESTRKEMEELYNIILGDPKIPTGGTVGDMGRLPNNLTELNTRGSQPLGSTGLLGVKFGWFGPYVNTGFDPQGYRNDAWGTAYAYGNPGAGQIRSAGPDRVLGNADDLIFPPNAVTFTGGLLVNLFVWDSSTSQFILNPKRAAFPSMSATVTLYYSNNGVQTLSAITVPPPADPPYSFNGFHAGMHAVTGTLRLSGSGPTVSGQAVVYVPGNNQQAQLGLYLR